jgi:hypothetical protein
MRENEGVIQMFLIKLYNGLRPEDTDEHDTNFIK